MTDSAIKDNHASRQRRDARFDFKTFSCALRDYILCLYIH